MLSFADFQREVTQVCLAATEHSDVALAGAGAIREHGLTTRQTEDIDLFTANTSPDTFKATSDALRQALEAHGLHVTVLRTSSLYNQLLVSNGTHEIEIDLAADWRKHPPTRLAIGNVLNELDAAASKVNALYSRAETRDFLDVDAIRRTGRFTDAALLRATSDRDPGFSIDRFAEQLKLVKRIPQSEVHYYNITAESFAAIQDRTLRWANDLTRSHSDDAWLIELLQRQAGQLDQESKPPHNQPGDTDNGRDR